MTGTRTAPGVGPTGASNEGEVVDSALAAGNAVYCEWPLYVSHLVRVAQHAERRRRRRGVADAFAPSDE
jgi:hypothetical protein